MSAQRPIAPENVLPQVTARLLRLGFFLQKRRSSGSRYLKMVGSPFRLRLSDHQWSGWNARRYPDVVCNVVLTESATEKELADLALSIALRFVLRVRLRLGFVREAA